MLSQSFECPSCGGSIVKKTPGARTLVCSYCGQTSHLNANSLEAAGEKHMLIDYGSVLQIGDVHTFDGREFMVLGRIRIDYEDGFWDEWYINFTDNNDPAWIQEDDGSFTLFSKIGEPDQNIDLNQVTVGQSMRVGMLPDYVFITSKAKAQVNGGEGELPFKVIPGDPADFFDGILDGKVISVETLPDDSAIFMGRPFELASLGI
ncbi:MAG: DUF4178 domain-containing protein [Bacteroidia bacterium]|nr:DUF4178 domain-containing protein [Bacteroidia bacterium]